MGHIATLAELEAVIGRTPPAGNLKVIDHLDDHALRWIAASPLAFLGFGHGSTISITLAGASPSFAGGHRTMLQLPLAALDDPALARAGAGFCSLFLAPGIGESLRINGRVAEVTADTIHIAVTECYVHCAKALIRSEFWKAPVVADDLADIDAFVMATRFMALATIDADGQADLSPKGDPAGSMTRRAGDAVQFADRPGNRRIDSFRNILAQPRVEALLLVPGSTETAIVRGTARLTDDPATREKFVVQGKAPVLVTCIEGAIIERRRSAALERARLWPVTAKADGIEPAKIFAAHVKLNKSKGLAARIAAGIVSIPGLMQKGLEKDYDRNLY